jgi:hypothetical protein
MDWDRWHNSTCFPHMRLDRICLREPIPEIGRAANYLREALSAHIHGDFQTAAELIHQSNDPAIRDWTESIWGRDGVYGGLCRTIVSLPRSEKVGRRMPLSGDKRSLLKRDGHHCRFCGIPVIRTEVRKRMQERYSAVLPWGSRNVEQHAAFQAMWLQFDHLVPYARGGLTDVDNMVITCAPCNYGRTNYTLEEAGLADPRTRESIRSTWNGLENFR